MDFFLFIWSILEPSRVQTLVLTQKDRDFLYRASLQSENRRRKVKSIEIRSHQDMGGLLLTFHELFGCLFLHFFRAPVWVLSDVVGGKQGYKSSGQSTFSHAGIPSSGTPMQIKRYKKYVGVAINGVPPNHSSS